MNFLYFGVFILGLLITGSQCHGLGLNFSTNYQTSRQPKINGNTVKISDFPSQVSIKYRFEHLCGGTILDETHILTAASCLISHHDTLLELKHLSILAGDVQLFRPNTEGENEYLLRQTKEVKKIYVHQSFDSVTRDNNIAIIVVDSSIRFEKETIDGVSIPMVDKATPQTTSIPNGILCKISGWASGEVGSTNSLRGTSVGIIHRKYCSEITKTNSSTICGVSTGSLCEGDMGGGLYCNRELTAIASIPKEQCSGVASYIEIHPFKSWIDETIKRSDEGNQYGDTFNGSGILTGSILLVLMVSVFSIM